MYYKQIHYLRGILALAVTISHFGFIMLRDAPFLIGAASMCVFTLIAGFFGWKTAMKLQGRQGAIPRFIWERFLRIYPVYWLFFVLSALWLLVDPAFVRKPLTISEWFGSASLLYFNGNPTCLLYPAWWLFDLVAFYVFLIPIIWQKKTWPIVLIIYMGLSVIGGRLWPNPPVYGMLPFCALFAFGAATAELEEYLAKIKKAYPLFLIIGGVTISLFLAGIDAGGIITRLAIFPRIGAIFLFLGIVLLEHKSSAESSIKNTDSYWRRTLNFLGDISYPLYVGHVLFLNGLFDTCGNRVNAWLLYFLIMFSTIISSALAHNYIEKKLVNTWLLKKSG